MLRNLKDEKARWSVDASAMQERLQSLGAELAAHRRLVVMGDFNIAPDDRDVHDPAAWQEKILCSTPEREALAALCALGLEDTFRLFDQEPDLFSWWDYRAAAFRRNLGLRIDLLLGNAPVRDAVEEVWTDRDFRKKKDGLTASDHAPVIVDLRD